MRKLLVVGVDGSPFSYPALRWALEYAGRVGARVRAVRCWMPVLKVRGWEVAVTGEPVTPAEQQAQARRQLADVVAAAPVGELVLRAERDPPGTGHSSRDGYPQDTDAAASAAPAPVLPVPAHR
jgi:nucleotide-binding universal stress UspA family protein